MATRTERFEWLGDSWAKWVVVAASFCILFVVNGTVATYGVFIAPIESTFGWSRTTVSLTFTIYLLATAVASPVTGNLIDRYGPSRTLPVFILLVGLPMLALSRIASLGHLYGLYVVVGFGVTGLALSHFSSIITKWFDSRTMLASGVAISGFSIGQLVFNPVAAELIQTYDWRTAYLTFGALALTTIPLAYFWVRSPAHAGADRDADAESAGEAEPGDDAETVGDAETDDGETGAAPDASGHAAASAEVESTADAQGSAPAESTAAESVVDVAVPDALTSWSLWLLVVTFFICGFTTVGLMTTHFVPYLLSIGFSGSVAATGQGVLGGMTVLGLIAMGAVGDRYGSKKRYVLASIYLLRGLTLFSLLAVTTALEMFAFATVYGFLTLCTVPLHAEITADRFGAEHLTTLVGLQYAGHQVGGATAALAAGWIFETMGSYQPAHLIGVGMLAVAPVLVLVDRSDRPTGD